MIKIQLIECVQAAFAAIKSSLHPTDDKMAALIFKQNGAENAESDCD
jgi:hypothetical protein